MGDEPSTDHPIHVNGGIAAPLLMSIKRNLSGVLKLEIRTGIYGITNNFQN